MSLAPADSVSSSARPRIRFREKRGGRFLREGAPWAYLDEIAFDRRTKALPPGSVAVLEDEERRPVATVALNAGTQVALRMLDPDPEAQIDGAWFAARFSAARDLRARLIGGEHYRLIHAEGDGLPGVIVDRFGPACVVQANAAWAEAHLSALLEGLDAALAPEVVVLNDDSRLRALEGLPPGRRLVKGTLDGPVEVPQNGAIYLADLLKGQKTGWYFDQRPNHATAALLAKGGRMLDVFAHSGGFSLAALAAGASSALAVDSSELALDLARAAAVRNGFGERFAAARADAFGAMTRLAEEGARFEVVVCDPPAFAPNRAALEAGLRAYRRTARLGAALVEPGGFLMLCSCSQAVEPEALREEAWAGMRVAGRRGRLVYSGRAGADHPIHPALPETGYLKTLAFQLD
ncbi:class I SAM-dependent rRNA methyltransferase [Neomegalonema perideroedes]|uniref:class I SAM-dependent rRNA methyltransferase n=1 Tax=Neomegalonema perideroedes TaxID=217219 RepID=UPI0003603EA8|nr:class I SAM-dependent methyltransferase [Neomegalonema perideroedes]